MSGGFPFASSVPCTFTMGNLHDPRTSFRQNCFHHRTIGLPTHSMVHNSQRKHSTSFHMNTDEVEICSNRSTRTPATERGSMRTSFARAPRTEHDESERRRSRPTVRTSSTCASFLLRYALVSDSFLVRHGCIQPQLPFLAFLIHVRRDQALVENQG